VKGPYLLVAMLVLFWIALTGSLAPVEVAVGAVTAVAVGLAMWRLFGKESKPLLLTLRDVMRLASYVPYLLKEIIVANIDVAEKVLDPRLPISPLIIPCHYPLSRDVSVAALANSITLTPGTLTVDVDGDTFYIHCLAQEFADSMPDGELYRHVKRVFGED